jgi:hypothetical protein
MINNKPILIVLDFKLIRLKVGPQGFQKDQMIRALEDWNSPREVVIGGSCED